MPKGAKSVKKVETLAEKKARLEAEMKALEAEEKQQEDAQKNAEKQALEEECSKLTEKQLRDFWVETMLARKKRQSKNPTKKKGGKTEHLCACACWYKNEEKPLIDDGTEKKSPYNDVKRCSGKGIHEVEIDGAKCWVCNRHSNEMKIKNGKTHHGFFEKPHDFPEEFLGSKAKKLWVKAIWEQYPTYRPENYEALLKEAKV